MVVKLLVATPVPVVSDATLVSIVPVLSTPGTPTDGDVFVCVTPTWSVQPSTDSADRPDLTTPPTFTEVPYALPSKPIFPVLASAGEAWTSTLAINAAMTASQTA